MSPLQCLQVNRFKRFNPQYQPVPYAFTKPSFSLAPLQRLSGLQWRNSAFDIKKRASNGCPRLAFFPACLVAVNYCPDRKCIIQNDRAQQMANCHQSHTVDCRRILYCRQPCNFGPAQETSHPIKERRPCNVHSQISAFPPLPWIANLR